MSKLPSLCCLLLLAACGGRPVETAPAEQQAAFLPAPNASCAWTYQPLWAVDSDATGCAVVQACPGTVLAPLAAGSGNLCDLPGQGNPDAAYCDDAPRWQVRSLDEVVAWQREGESRPVQYSTWPCGI